MISGEVGKDAHIHIHSICADLVPVEFKRDAL